MMKVKLHQLISDLDINDYHNNTAGYSSSKLKDVLEDEEIFVAKHIRKEVEREENPAFDVGTYMHTGILEPHKLKQDCVVYPGKVRRGKEWDKFKVKNKGRTIVTKSQKDQAEGLIKAVQKSKIAKAYLDGKAEVSLYVELVVYRGEVYAPYFGKILDANGWSTVKPTLAHEAKKNGTVLLTKVRADTLGKTYISDLKSTSGNAKVNQAMRNKVSDFEYDLSAALYLDLFSLIYPAVTKFIWIFASKETLNCRCYRASDTNIRVGRAKYRKALIKIAHGMKTDWKQTDYLDTLEPMPHELRHLETSDRDLL